MSFLVVIPVRLNSSRLPKKPLLDIGGKSLIRRVYEKSSLSKADEVIVATDHESIVRECKSFGARTLLTQNYHKTGTDRIAEAVSILKLKEDRVIVNVQGDEPFLDPSDINSLGKLVYDKEEVDLATLYSKLENHDENNPNVVKIWLDNKQVISFSRKNDFMTTKDVIKGKHLGLYAYRVSFLKEFIAMDRTPNEIKEELEQLRALDNGKKIVALKSKRDSYLGIDTSLDLDLARSRIMHDKD